MMNKCWILFLVFAVCASASEKCEKYSFKYKGVEFSLCSDEKTKVKTSEVGDLRFYDYGTTLYVVGSSKSLDSFFQKSGFKPAKEKCNFDKYCEYAQKDLVATNIEHHLAKWSSTTNDLPVEVRYNQEENVFGIYQKENAQTLGPKKGTQKAIPIY